MLPNEPDALAPDNVPTVDDISGRKLDVNNNSGGVGDGDDVAAEAHKNKALKFSARRVKQQQQQQQAPLPVLQRRGSDEVDDAEFLYPVLGCANCSDLFPTRHELLLHRLQAHHLQPYQCPDCMATFPQVALLDAHQLTHTHDQPHACTHASCTRRFSLKVHVKTHARAMHPQPRGLVAEYRCDICADKVFQSAGALTNHRRYHSDERPFVCDMCTSKFKLQSNLTRHMKKSHPPMDVLEA